MPTLPATLPSPLDTPPSIPAPRETPRPEPRDTDFSSVLDEQRVVDDPAPIDDPPAAGTDAETDTVPVADTPAPDPEQPKTESGAAQPAAQSTTTPAQETQSTPQAVPTIDPLGVLPSDTPVQVLAEPLPATVDQAVAPIPESATPVVTTPQPVETATPAVVPDTLTPAVVPDTPASATTVTTTPQPTTQEPATRSDAQDPATPNRVTQQAPAATAKQDTGAFTSEDRSSRGGTSHGPVTREPALGRAMQVQAAVAVENLTAQTPSSVMTLNAAATLNAPTLGTTQIASAVAGTATPLDETAETLPRVVRGLNAMVNQRGGAMTMRMQPPSLGELRVQMTIAGGVVNAVFQPATAEAAALLDRSLGSLRASLESHGLTVERLSVQPLPQASASQTAREQADEQAQQQQQREQQDAAEGRSRGRRDEEPTHGNNPQGFTEDLHERFPGAFQVPEPESDEGAQAA